MGPKHVSIKQLKKFSFIGQLAAEKKSIRDADSCLKEQKEVLEVKSEELRQLKIRTSELSKVLVKEKTKLSKKKKRLSLIKIAASGVQAQICESKARSAFSVSLITSKKRKANPTTSSIPARAKVIRRNETLDAAIAIHGASLNNPDQAFDGLLDTLSAKCSSKKLSEKVINLNKPVVKHIKTKVLKEWSESFEKSEENILRSLNTYYSHNVMGKAKYISIRKANKIADDRKSEIPNYIPYKELSEKIRSIDIGTLHDLQPSLTNESIQGMYRPLDEYLIRLAKFYLKVNNDRLDKLKWFHSFEKKDAESFLFNVTFGGDGAPISGCVFLVSFLNVGKRIASSKENFLIFGANVEEDSPVVRQFVFKTISDMRYLESKVFNVDINGAVMKVEFKLSELPNDMKMLAFLGGELSNSATYFTTFADVYQSGSNDVNKTFGLSQTSDWKPFSYKKRVSDSKLVDKKKSELEKSKAGVKTKRSNLTTYISNTLKSRQEFIPLVGEYIGIAKSEPLHLKNNVTKELFMKLFRIVISNSNLKNIHVFSEAPSDSLFSKLIDFLRTKMGCNFLSKKLITWFNESSLTKGEKQFTFRFRGKESFAYMKHFPTLISMVLGSIINNESKLKLHQLFFCSLFYRRVINYSVRIDDYDTVMQNELEKNASCLYKACCLFYPRISVSLWVLSNALPVHASETYRLYGYGIGCNTMEAREQKHQQIAKYSENTTVQNRWSQIFRHEYIQLIYLRENGYDTRRYRKRSTKYIPDFSNHQCKQCGLDLFNGKCPLCGSEYFIEFSKKVC